MDRTTKMTRLQLLSIFVLFSTASVEAHQAVPTAANPTGWAYDFGCCAKEDCSQISSALIRETNNGYLVITNGDLIPYKDARIKRSQDEFFHLCIRYDKHTRCLYVPNRGF